MAVAVVSGVIVVASEAEAGSSNFLIPNGTFFFVLAIFLIVFGVIAKFVVQPVQKVLEERDRLVAQTALDNRRAAEEDAAAEAGFKQELLSARSQAGGLRDQARSQGRAVADDLRAEATGEVSDKLREASEDLKVQGESLAPSLDASLDNLSMALANRILGLDADTASAATVERRK